MSSQALRSFGIKEIGTLTDSEPFIAYFLLQSVVKEDDTFPYAAAVFVKAGVPHLILNPTRMNEFSHLEKVGVLIHEYLHIMLSHCTTRTTLDRSRRTTENIAMDMAINQLVVKEWALPEGAVFHNQPRYNYPENLMAEEYFELLKKDNTEEDLGKQYKGFDSHEMWSEDNDQLSTEIIKQMARKYLAAKGGLGKTLEGAGRYADHLVSVITAVKSNQVDWRSKARMFICRVVDHKRVFTWKRSSKRYGFPLQGTKSSTKSKVLVIVDTSGSMSEVFLAYIGGQLNLMTRIMHIDVVFVDAEAHDKIKKFRPSSTLSFPGRGGTDMQPGFDLAVEEKYKGVICFTDGDLYRTPSCALKTLWVIVNNEQFVPPFGTVAHVNWRE
jgi:predicted metal-dependent peptidase